MWSPIPELEAHGEALREAARKEPLGIYVHVPFCASRCAYCSFTRTEDRRLTESYRIRLEYALSTWGEHLEHPGVDTLYLGGGTPSLLRISDLQRITGTLRQAFRLGGLREATLEANPGTTSLPWLVEARNLGWNRLSLGVQSLDNGLLQALGRVHRSEEALQTLAWAREAGFRHLSADLMLGIPGQSLDRVMAEVAALVEAGVDHLSVYMLDLDKDSLLARRISAGELDLPPEDAVADAYESLHATLPSLGLACYEISNFAKPGKESLHNSRYWERRPYLGVGPSAASQLAHLRWTEAADIPAWIEGRGRTEVETLDPEEELAETAMLGLRTARGVDWEGLRRTAEIRGLQAAWSRWDRDLQPFRTAGHLQDHKPRIALTERGMLLSQQVFEIFVP